MKDMLQKSGVGALKEQFIPDNVFLYVTSGTISVFDGDKSYSLKAGECGLVRKNSLVKFLLNNKDEFEPIVFCFDEKFLKTFQKKHPPKSEKPKAHARLIQIKKSELIDNFINSLRPYIKGVMQLDSDFEDLKYEELLLILLRNNPELSSIFFDFGIPNKKDLEEFMVRNFTFNVSISHFAFLTGRSLSAFKRDFKTIFNDTPGNWLTKKRLQEAYFLIDKKSEKPADFYLDLGFENLSHFSFAFKKMFGINPTELVNQKK